MARDTDSPSPPRSEVLTSLTAELLFAANLVASADGNRSGVPEGWVERQRSEMSPGALAVVPDLEGFWWPTMGLIDFLAGNEAFHDPEAFLTDVLSAPLDRYVEVLFNGDLTREQVRRFLETPSASAEIPEPDCQFCQFSESTPEARIQLFRNPSAHRDRLVTLIRGSDTPWFRATFASWQKAAEPEIRTLRQRLLLEHPMDLAQSLRKKTLSGTFRYERFTFIPSRLTGHRQVRSWAGSHIVFYIQEGQIDPSDTGAAAGEIAEFLKVLGDKTRMDILHLLTEGPSYGKELAARLGLTTATVSRHLDQLKAVGLVNEERVENNVKRVTLAPRTLDDQLNRLRAFLPLP